MEAAVRLHEPHGERALLDYHAVLLREFGPQGWWPARTRWEVILGAILTQNTNWGNAALALKQLRRAGQLSLRALRRTPRPELERLIRPAGFFRQKAATIRGVVEWLDRRYHGSIDRAFAQPQEVLRRELLELKGVGPETADAILLYAARMPFFVADAYTRRILARHGLIDAEADYTTAQGFLHRHLPADHRLFSEFHALLVEAGKRYCKRSVMRCEACPLQGFLPGRLR